MAVGQVQLTEQAALEALATTQEIAEDTHRAIRELLAHVRAGQTPARFETIVLSTTTPNVTNDNRGDQASGSIGVINPTSAKIFLGVGGGRASAAARALAVPPNAAMILPVAVAELEVGADPADLAAGDAVIYLLRFEAVQLFHLWRL